MDFLRNVQLNFEAIPKILKDAQVTLRMLCLILYCYFQRKIIEYCLMVMVMVMVSVYKGDVGQNIKKAWKPCYKEQWREPWVCFLKRKKIFVFIALNEED